MLHRHAARAITLSIAAGCALLAAPGFAPGRAVAQDVAQNAAPDTLRTRFATVSAQTTRTVADQGVYLQSTEASDHLQGDVYTLIDRPYADVRAALARAEPWCAILVLHLNVKYCRASPAGEALAVGLGRKVDEPLADVHWVHFDYRLTRADAGYFGVTLQAPTVYSGGSFGRRAAPPTAPRAEGATAWRDTDLQLDGPVVAELQKLFLAAWASQKGEPLAAKNWFPAPVRAGNLVVRAIGSSPEEPYSLIYATLLSAIGSAETSVRLTNAYFAPDPQLLTALEAAAARGVDVTLILPGRTDSWLVFHAGRGYFERLLRAGVKIYARRGVVLHSKTALVDGVWATVGSTNLDWRSFLHNHELNAVVLGAEFGSQLQTMFDRDLAESDLITLAQWQQRGLGLRLKELFARTWEYWL